MKIILLVLLGLSIVSFVASANQDETINATGLDLTKTISFEDTGYKSAKLKDLDMLVNDPFLESEALINLHIIRNPGYGMGNWRIECYCNGVLVSRDMSTTEGDAWITFKIPTGCLENGSNRIYLWSSGWEVMLLKDSNITIIQREASSGMTLEDFGFETSCRNVSLLEFDDDTGNQKGNLMLHYMTITPGGSFSYGNWNLVIKLNDIKIGDFNGLGTGDNLLEIAIPSGIINKGANKLEFRPYDWPVLILEDSNLTI